MRTTYAHDYEGFGTGSVGDWGWVLFDCPTGFSFIFPMDKCMMGTLDDALASTTSTWLFVISWARRSEETHTVYY